jgi:hypothetical protein
MSQWIWTARRSAYSNEKHATLQDIQEKQKSIGNNVLHNEKSTKYEKQERNGQTVEKQTHKKDVMIMTSFLVCYFLRHKTFFYLIFNKPVQILSFSLLQAASRLCF